MKHGLLVMLGAGVLALDYAVYRMRRLAGADDNLRISLRDRPLAERAEPVVIAR